MGIFDSGFKPKTKRERAKERLQDIKRAQQRKQLARDQEREKFIAEKRSLKAQQLEAKAKVVGAKARLKEQENRLKKARGGGFVGNALGIGAKPHKSHRKRHAW